MYIKFYYITLADVKILLHCKMKLLLQLVVSVRKHYSVRYIGPVKNTLCHHYTAIIIDHYIVSVSQIDSVTSTCIVYQFYITR